MTITSSTSAWARLSSIARRRPIASVALALFALLCLALIAGYAALQTEPGRVWLARTLESALSQPGTRDVSIGRIDGRLPAEIRIDEFTIADDAGTWLTARRLTVEWHPLALLGGRLEITTADAREVVLARRPAATGPAKEGGLPGLPTLEIEARRVTVHALHLEEPLMGVAASLRAAAEVNVSADAVRARLDISRTDAVAGHANALIEFDPASGSLDLHAALSEPAGGLTARLLRLPQLPAIELTVSGDGPAADWRGAIDLNAEELVSAKSLLAISIDESEARIALEGTVRPGAAAGMANSVFGPETEFAVALSRRIGSDTLIVAVDRLRSAAMEAAGTAELALSQGEIIGGNIQIATRDATRIAPLVAPGKFRSARIEGRIRGHLAHPEIDLDAGIGGAEFKGWTAGKIDLKSVIRPDGPIGSGPVRVSARATLADFRSPVRELNAVLGDNLQVTVAQSALERAQLRIGDATVAGAAVRGSLVGAAAFETGRLSASGQLEIDDLSPLSERAGRALEGQLRSRYQISYDPADALSIVLDGTVHSGRFGSAVAEALVGAQALFAGNIERSAIGQWKVSDATVRGAGAAATVQLAVSPGGAEITAEYGIRVSDLTALGLADPDRPDGYLEIRGSASGPGASPEFAGTATLTAAAPGGIPVDRLTANYTLPGLARQTEGKIELEGKTPLLPDLSGRLDFALKDTSIELAPLRLTARGTVVSGSLAIPLAGPPVTGSLTVATADLRTWSPVAQRALSGDLKADVTLSADQARQGIFLKASAGKFALDDTVAAEDLSATAKMSDVLGDRKVTVSVASRAGRIGPLKVEALAAELTGTVENADFALRTSGEFRGPLRLEAGGAVRRNGQQTTLTISRLAGQAMGVPVALKEPAVAEFGAGATAADVGLTLSNGTIEASLKQTSAEISLEATARSVPLALFWADAPSQARNAWFDANAALNGPLAAPEGRFDLSLSGLAPGEPESAPEGLALNVEASLQNNVLTANGRFKGLHAVSAEADARLPVRVSLVPFSIGIDNAAPASGRIDYDGPVRPLAALTELDRHRVDGKAQIRLALSGSLRAPRIEGNAQLTEGRYENFDTGTILTDVTLRARPANNSIVIEEATAGDGSGGRITVAGSLGLGGVTGMTVDLDAAFEKARLVRRDEATVVSSGAISLRGDAAKRKVVGRLAVDEAEIRLISSTRPGVVQIDVEETGTLPAGAPPPAPVPKSSSTYLDLVISVPKRVFVRGRGLDSEWAGELQVTGTTASPRLQGSLRPLRGRYNFLGKIFTLREGSIDFTGADRIDPVLDLSAERAVTDLTAIVRVSGTARRPEVELDSNPEVPQDEILSRILFNKSTGRLSALEAVQLGQAAASMTGATNSGGIIDLGRRMLDLDVLDVKSTDAPADGATTSRTSVEAGKYVTDDVYIGVEGGAAGATGATVEIEVTPRVRIEGDVGQKEKESIGLKWKRDY